MQLDSKSKALILREAFPPGVVVKAVNLLPEEPIEWPRPPLIVPDLMVGSRHMRDFAYFGFSSDFSFLRGIWEEFVNEYFTPDKPSRHGYGDFLTKMMPMHERMQDWLFPVEMRDPRQAIAVLLWGIHQSIDHSTIEIGKNTCEVSYEGVSLGVRDSKIISRFNLGVVKSFDFMNVIKSNHLITRERFTKRGRSTLLSQVYELSEDIDNPELAKTIGLALSYTYYLTRDLTHVANNFYGGPRLFKIINRAKETAWLLKHCKKMSNPMPQIHKRLIHSGLITSVQYKYFFKRQDQDLLRAGLEDYPVSDLTRARLCRALKRISRLRTDSVMPGELDINEEDEDYDD